MNTNYLGSTFTHALLDAVSTYSGPDTAIGLKPIFGLSKADEIHALMVDAGCQKISMTVNQLDLELSQLQEFIPRYVSATPMAMGFNSASTKQQQAIIQEVSEHLDSYTSEIGIIIPFRTHLVVTVK